jgi:hypothetical protein
LPGGNGKWEPPDPIPNSEVKLLSADDSVGSPHVKVGHCQALIQKPPSAFWRLGVFLYDLVVSPFLLKWAHVTNLSGTNLEVAQQRLQDQAQGKDCS